MRAGVLGTGDVGQVLGAAFATLGHEVRMGSRTPDNEKARAWVARVGHRASAGTFADAAAFGELIVLATLWEGTEHALRLAGAESFAGKVVIDATNPLDFSAGMPRLAVGHTDSGGERIQRWIPDARVVKAYNTIGNAHMFHPDFPGGPPDMFICGNDDAAKETVREINAEFGFETVDIGGIEGARYLEPLAMVWISYAIRTGTWNHAFKLLRK
jgi:predicted dinucleotide-binding enzyme